MSTKDAKLTYAILGVIAIAVIAVLASLYADRVAKNTEMMAKAVKTGTVPAGARSAPTRTAQAARPQSAQGPQASLMRTTKIERHRNMPTAGGSAGLGLTRSAATEAARSAKPEGGQPSDVSPTRSADMPKSQSATLPAEPAAGANRARSMPKQAAQAAIPSAATDVSATRSAGAQPAQTAQPTAEQASQRALSRSAATQTAQAAKTGGQSEGLSLARAAGVPLAQATQPTSGQAFHKSLSRSAGIGMQAAKPAGGQSAALVLARSSSAQTAQAAPSERDKQATSRSLPPEANKAAQAPLALQRRWDPERTPEASPDQDLDQQEL